MVIRNQTLTFIKLAIIAWKGSTPALWKQAKDRVKQFLEFVPAKQYEQIESWASKVCRIIMLDCASKCATAEATASRSSEPGPSSPAADAAVGRETLQRVPKAWKTLSFVLTLRRWRRSTSRSACGPSAVTIGRSTGDGLRVWIAPNKVQTAPPPR